MRASTRRTALQVGLAATAAGGAAFAAWRFRKQPIRVGVLHSLTGTMSLSERPVVDATLFAIELVNQSGGLLGRRVEPVVVDGRSDGQHFAREADALLRRGDISVVFGCWTSASRKSVVPVFERHRHLLVYPVQYEGLEQSPNVIYTGAAPNQQIIPAVAWAFENVGRSFFLVGSDYVFPRTANEITKDQLRAIGATLVGEQYLPLGSRDVDACVRAIVEARPSVILNTINGDTNLAFFRALRAAGITPSRIPTVSFSIGEPELQSLGDADVAGDFAAWNYFQSIASAKNRAWISAFRQRYGANRTLSDPMEAAFVGVQLWAQAVRSIGEFSPRAARLGMLSQSVEAPEGVVAIDADTGHCWKSVRIGRARRDGQFDIVWNSDRPARPEPFPIYRSEAEWQRFLRALYEGWGARWSAPARG
ncbi:MAG: urea ABC transporter substrate-binding protein [Myxococcales bacterium]|nr:urea ABC transporter substrate-binding protein [Myxococcales bacterium]